MTFQTFLPDLLWEPLVRTSLLEDLGTGGDVTTQALLDPKRPLQAIFRVRKKGVLAGLQGAKLAFTLLDKSVRFLPQKNDGEQIIAGDVLAVVEGGAGAVLAGERTALNLLSHLSGIATATREIVDAVDGTNVRICCTRKTLPRMARRPSRPCW